MAALEAVAGIAIDSLMVVLQLAVLAHFVLLVHFALTVKHSESYCQHSHYHRLKYAMKNTVFIIIRKMEDEKK